MKKIIFKSFAAIMFIIFFLQCEKKDDIQTEKTVEGGIYNLNTEKRESSEDTVILTWEVSKEGVFFSLLINEEETRFNTTAFEITDTIFNSTIQDSVYLCSKDVQVSNKVGKYLFELSTYDGEGTLMREKGTDTLYLRDIYPPAPIENLTANMIDEIDYIVELKWENPLDNDLDSLRIQYGDENSDNITKLVHKTITSTNIQLINPLIGVKYTFQVFPQDTAGNITPTSPEASVVIRDVVPPGEVTGFTATQNTNYLSAFMLDWTPPTDADLDSFLITYSGEGVLTENKKISKNEELPYPIVIPQISTINNIDFTVKAIDASGNESEGVTTNANVDETIIFVNNATELDAALLTGGNVFLTADIDITTVNNGIGLTNKDITDKDITLTVYGQGHTINSSTDDNNDTYLLRARTSNDSHSIHITFIRTIFKDFRSSITLSSTDGGGALMGVGGADFGLSTDADVSLTLYNCLLSNIVATSSAGGSNLITAFASAELYIYNTTLVQLENCGAANKGAVIKGGASTGINRMFVYNSIGFFKRTGQNAGDMVRLNTWNINSVPTDNNFRANMVDYDNEDYTPKDGAANLVDEGNIEYKPSFMQGVGLEYDIDILGNPRVKNGGKGNNIDLGAIERQGL